MFHTVQMFFTFCLFCCTARACVRACVCVRVKVKKDKARSIRSHESRGRRGECGGE